MRWTVLVARPAQKQRARFPAKDQARISAAIAQMADDPFAGDVLKLEGEACRWRRRVGSYWIFFSVDAAVRTGVGQRHTPPDLNDLLNRVEFKLTEPKRGSPNQTGPRRIGLRTEN
jgi:mRNA-degrading endonuclease RelE of RelBE toxin-antitoxin system